MEIEKIREKIETERIRNMNHILTVIKNIYFGIEQMNLLDRVILACGTRR